MQRRGIKVAATAAQSPFNNLPDTFHYWSSPKSYIPSTESSYPLPPAWIVPCVIVLLGSYRRYYGLNDLFKTAIKPQYLAFAEKYWSDYILDEEIAKKMPPAAGFLTDGFFERFTNDTNSKLLRRLAANSSTFWDYDLPIRTLLRPGRRSLAPKPRQDGACGRRTRHGWHSGQRSEPPRHVPGEPLWGQHRPERKAHGLRLVQFSPVTIGGHRIVPRVPRA